MLRLYVFPLPPGMDGMGLRHGVGLVFFFFFFYSFPLICGGTFVRMLTGLLDRRLHSSNRVMCVSELRLSLTLRSW